MVAFIVVVDAMGQKAWQKKVYLRAKSQKWGLNFLFFFGKKMCLQS